MMNDDKDYWLLAVEEELNNMKSYVVWTPQKLQATKKKTNGMYQSRLNSRYYEKVEGLHYNA